MLAPKYIYVHLNTLDTILIHYIYITNTLNTLDIPKEVYLRDTLLGSTVTREANRNNQRD